MSRLTDPAGLRWQLISIAAILVTAALAWLLIFSAGGPLFSTPVLCTGTLLGSIPGGAQLSSALAWVSHSQLAVSWYVMLMAMMLPVVTGAVIHVQVRSFRSDRMANSFGFILGYLAIWMLAGLPIIFLALFLHLLINDTAVLFVASLGLAVIWQITAWKQFALNKCHARPSLTVFGSQPLLASTRFGVSYALWCLVSCAPLMLTTLMMPVHGPVWMLVVAVWIWAERLEVPRAPAYRLTVPKRAFRAGQFRISALVNRYKLP